jgi:acyl dehydratase
MNHDSTKPIYEWEVAKVGDKRATISLPIKQERIDLYVSSTNDPNSVLSNEAFALEHGFETVAVPVAMTTRVAPHNRRAIMIENGYEHPVRPTPFARWQCRLFAPMKPGDVITSEAHVADKFEKRGRKYIVWEVVAHNQHGEKVAEYRTTNCWDGTKPADKTR